MEVLRVKYATAPYALAWNYQLIPCFVLHELVALPIIRPSSPTGTVISPNPGVLSALRWELGPAIGPTVSVALGMGFDDEDSMASPGGFPRVPCGRGTALRRCNRVGRPPFMACSIAQIWCSQHPEHVAYCHNEIPHLRSRLSENVAPQKEAIKAVDRCAFSSFS